MILSNLFVLMLSPIQAGQSQPSLLPQPHGDPEGPREDPESCAPPTDLTWPPKLSAKHKTLQAECTGVTSNPKN